MEFKTKAGATLTVQTISVLVESGGVFFFVYARDYKKAKFINNNFDDISFCICDVHIRLKDDDEVEELKRFFDGFMSKIDSK